MTALKFAHLTTALFAILAVAFGWGTWWFTAGVFVGCVSLILDGLGRYIASRPEPTWSPFDEHGELRDLQAEGWEVESASRHRESMTIFGTDGSVTTHHGIGPIWDDEPELPYKATEPRPHWPNDIGAFE